MFVAASFLAAALGASFAAAQSNFSAQAPDAPKAAAGSFLLPAGTSAVSVRLDAIDSREIDAVKEANRQAVSKAIQIGVGRTLDAGLRKAAGSLRWVPVPGGMVAQLELTSPDARALRIGLAVARITPGSEIRFAGSAQIDTVYGPFSSRDMDANDETYWSPVLEGERALVELFAPLGSGFASPGLDVLQVSHLFVSAADSRFESAAKSLAGFPSAGACEVDLICRSSTDSALANTGKALAAMIFTKNGGTSACTGTLLNPLDGSFTAYFYSANHCFGTQTVASTLTTHWFYDRTGCGSGGTNPSYVQLAGGATLLYANPNSDVLFVRLNGRPPTGAVFSGWDAATLVSGTSLLHVAHPSADLTKVTLATAGGFDRGINNSDGTMFIRVTYPSTSTGVAEPGGSGGGIFTAVGQPASSYRHRGGLFGGPSSCSSTGSNLRDSYSRLDQVYPALAQYLNPGALPVVTNLLANPGFESGGASWVRSSGVTITSGAASAHAGSAAITLGGRNSATDQIYQDVSIPATVAQARLQFWFRITTAETQPIAYDVMDVGLYNPSTSALRELIATYSNRDATADWVLSSSYDISDYKGQTVRFAFSAQTNSSNVTTFSIDDVAITTEAPNYTALWWNQAESGWGLNINHQGDILFATLFTYDSAGNPMWLVMSGGARQGTGESFTGDLYRTTGPAFNAQPFTPIGPSNISRVGTMSLSFSGSTGTLTYGVNGVNVTKSIQKQSFGTRIATCQPTAGTRTGLTNYQDLWFNSAESGWGVNLTQQDDTIFATLFTYDPNGQGVWLVMSGGAKQSDGSYLGDLYRTTGPAFNAQPFTPIGPGNISRVGTMRFRFSNGVTGTLDYTYNGVSVSKSIARQLFSTPAPACTS